MDPRRSLAHRRIIAPSAASKTSRLQKWLRSREHVKQNREPTQQLMDCELLSSSVSPADSGVSLTSSASPDLIASLFKLQAPQQQSVAPSAGTDMAQLASLLNLQLRPVAQCGICSEMILVRSSEDVLAHIQLAHTDVLGQLLLSTLKAQAPSPPTPVPVLSSPIPPPLVLSPSQTILSPPLSSTQVLSPNTVPSVVAPPASITVTTAKKPKVPMSSYFRFISGDDALCALCLQMFAKTSAPELALHLLNSHPQEAILASISDLSSPELKDVNENVEKLETAVDESMDADLMEILKKQKLIVEEKDSVQALVQQHMLRSIKLGDVDFPLKSLLNTASTDEKIISSVWHNPKEKRGVASLLDASSVAAAAAAALVGGAAKSNGDPSLVTSMQRSHPTTHPLHGYLNGLNGPNAFAFPYSQVPSSSSNHVDVPAWKPFDKDEEKKDPPATKRGRPTENPCWNYFHRLDEQNVRCRLCSKIVKSACATNMTKHLERHHHEHHQELLVQIRHYRRLKAPATSSSPSSSSSSSLSHSAPSSAQPVNQAERPNFEGSASMPSTPLVKGETDGGVPFKPEYEFFNGFDRHNPGAVGNSTSTSSDDWTQLGGRRAWGSEGSFDWPSTSNVGSNEWRADAAVAAMQASASAPSLPQLNNNQQPVKRREKPYAKRNRKTEHPVWQFFARTAEGDARCALCTALVRSPCSSNFMRHLMRHHAQEYQRVYTSWLEKRTLHLRPSESVVGVNSLTAVAAPLQRASTTD